MGLSNVSGAHTIMQPGVCTSTTRPASPYHGQMIFETDTNRVKVWLGSEWHYGTLHNISLFVDYLVVAGGGSGGSGYGGVGGGGGCSMSSNNDLSAAGAGSGGSGVVILRCINDVTITIGAGLTGTTATDGSYKVTTLTAGSGNVSWA